MLAACLAFPCVAPALAENAVTWRQKIGTFRIGVVAEPGTGGSHDGLAALDKAYTLALGVPVEVSVVSDYRELAEAQIGHAIDYGIYSATAYAAAVLSCDCLSPLVAPVSGNGALGIRAVLIAKHGGPADISAIGKYRVAVSGHDDVAGFLLPIAALRRVGIAATGAEPFLVHAGSASEAETLFLTGQVDAMFGWVETGIGRPPLPGAGTPDHLVAQGAADGTFRIVWSSELLRYGPHAIRRDLDPEVRRRLAPFLIGLKDTDPELFEILERTHTGGFASVNDGDYIAALDMLRAAASAN